MVIGFSVSAGFVLSFIPALGSLVLFPPVVEVTGPEDMLYGIRLAQKTLVVLIDSSRPIHPSQLLIDHRTPQVLLPYPVQASAADWADVLRADMIV